MQNIKNDAITACVLIMMRFILDVKNYVMLYVQGYKWFVYHGPRRDSRSKTEAWFHNENTNPQEGTRASKVYFMYDVLSF